MQTPQDDFQRTLELCQELDEREQADGARLVEAMICVTCFAVAVVYAVFL